MGNAIIKEHIKKMGNGVMKVKEEVETVKFLRTTYYNDDYTKIYSVVVHPIIDLGDEDE